MAQQKRGRQKTFKFAPDNEPEEEEEEVKLLGRRLGSYWSKMFCVRRKVSSGGGATVMQPGSFFFWCSVSILKLWKYWPRASCGECMTEAFTCSFDFVYSFLELSFFKSKVWKGREGTDQRRRPGQGCCSQSQPCSLRRRCNQGEQGTTERVESKSVLCSVLVFFQGWRCSWEALEANTWRAKWNNLKNSVI